MRRQPLRFHWRGVEAVEGVIRKQTAMLNYMGEQIVLNARLQLYPGHGYITGNLYRSLYYRTTRSKYRIGLDVGSRGIKYAVYVEEGHHSFEGYHMIRTAFDYVLSLYPEIAGSYKL